VSPRLTFNPGGFARCSERTAVTPEAVVTDRLTLQADDEAQRKGAPLSRPYSFAVWIEVDAFARAVGARWADGWGDALATTRSVAGSSQPLAPVDRSL